MTQSDERKVPSNTHSKCKKNTTKRKGLRNVHSYEYSSLGANVGREYTPTTLDALDRGYFDLVVKRYANGYFSDEVFSRLRPGVDSLGFRGPVTTLPYARGAADELCLIAGGTGITPMYQIMRTALRDPLDHARKPGREQIILHLELERLP